MDLGAFAVSVLGSVGAAAAFIAIWSWRGGARIAKLESDAAKALATAERALTLATEQESATMLLTERLKNDRERQAERWEEIREKIRAIAQLR